MDSVPRSRTVQVTDGACVTDGSELHEDPQSLLGVAMAQGRRVAQIQPAGHHAGR